jgi:hypothetical protein
MMPWEWLRLTREQKAFFVASFKQQHEDEEAAQKKAAKDK